jgi:hypothetical protein
MLRTMQTRFFDFFVDFYRAFPRLLAARCGQKVSKPSRGRPFRPSLSLGTAARH